MITLTTAEELIELEREIRYRSPPDAGQAPFRSVPGTGRVLLSAPHGAAHRRENRYKEEDEYTAAFVRLLGARTGAHVLYAWARSDSDPNWDQQSPYKESLRSLVRDEGIGFVMDFHGMSNRHRFGIAVGTMDGRSCPEQELLILETLQQQGYHSTTAQEARGLAEQQWDRYVLNHRRFTGGIISHTITRFALEELRIGAVQIELCAGLRVARRPPTTRHPSIFAGDPAAIAHTMATFELVIQRLAAAVG